MIAKSIGFRRESFPLDLSLQKNAVNAGLGATFLVNEFRPFYNIENVGRCS